jgi:hypothetical protein
MVELERLLAEALVRDEPVVPPSSPLASAIATLDAGADDLRLDDLRLLALADPCVAVELLADTGAEELPVAAAADPALLAVARAAARRVPVAGPLRALRDRAWRLSVITALLARELARARGVAADGAYASGLIRGAGTLAALSAFERLAAGARPASAVRLSTWQRLAERWASPLGAALAERRRLPASIAAALGGATPAGGEPVGPVLRVVRTVSAAVAVLLGGSDPDEAPELADLTDEETSLLAAALPAAEAHVARLERLAPRRAPRATAAAAPARERNGRGPRLWLAGREYAAVGFAPHQLLVSGPAPLGEGALLEVAVLDGRAEFHARVIAAWAEGERFGAILVPFGLSGPALADFGGVIPAGGAA